MNTNENYLQEFVASQARFNSHEASYSITDADLSAMLLDDELELTPDSLERVSEQAIPATTKPTTARKPKIATVAAVKAFKPSNINKIRKKVSINSAIRELWENSRKAKENDISPAAIYRHLPKTMGDYIKQRDEIPLKMPRWKEAPDKTKAAFHIMAMSNLEENYILAPFSFVMTDELYKKCLTDNLGFAPYLQNRLSVSLNNSIGRVPLFMFQFEYESLKNMSGSAMWNIKQGDGTHPHIHGSVLLRMDELKKAKSAFYKVNGKMTDKEKTTAHRWGIAKREKLISRFGKLSTDIGWCFVYCGKAQGTAKRLSGQKSVSAVSRKVSSLAESIYDEVAELVNKNTKSATSQQDLSQSATSQQAKIIPANRQLPNRI